MITFLLLMITIIVLFITDYRRLYRYEHPIKSGHKWKKICIREFKCNKCGITTAWNYNLNKYTKAKRESLPWLIATNIDYGTCEAEKMHSALQ